VATFTMEFRVSFLPLKEFKDLFHHIYFTIGQ